VAIALRQGINLRDPHTHRCRAIVDALGQHSLICKQALGRIARHQHLNDLVTCASVSAGIPALLAGYIPDGLPAQKQSPNQPHRMTLIFDGTT